MSVIKSSKAVAEQKQQPKTSYEWVGYGRKKVAGANSKIAGQSYVEIVFDKGISAINGLDAPDFKFHLYANNQREGKDDAEYRAVVLTPEE